MVVLHLLGEIDFLGRGTPVSVTSEFHQAAAGTVGRGGEHQAVVVDRRGTVDPRTAGSLVIPPEELAVGGRTPTRAFWVSCTY